MWRDAELIEGTDTFLWQSWRSNARLSKQKSGVRFTTSGQISYKIWKLAWRWRRSDRIRRGLHSCYRPFMKEERVTRLRSTLEEERKKRGRSSL